MHYKVLRRTETVNSETYKLFLDDMFASFSSYDLRQQRKAVLWETAVQHMASCFLCNIDLHRIKDGVYSTSSSSTLLNGY